MNVKEIMVKKPFRRICPDGYMSKGLTDGKEMADIDNPPIYRIVTQGDFLREYYPSGHRINDPLWYPNIVHRVKEEVDGKEIVKTYEEVVERCAFAFQRIIAVKHLIHLCGNNVKFEMTIPEPGEEDNGMFFRFKKGWLTKNMEIAWFEAAKSVKITGDTAFVGYMKDKKFHWKILSYLNGDRLFPHYDSMTGELDLFARAYADYDEDGKTVTDWLEVWDENYLYRLKRGNTGVGGIITRVKKAFGASGYSLVGKPEPHNCPSIPVSYHRCDEGACWTNSQDVIESYELAFSRLVQNNASYAFPIMLFKGEDIEIQGDTMRGTVKSITAPSDAEISFLQKQDVSNAFVLQLDRTLKAIYEQSFAVQVPEVKSGDLPGVAIKLLFTPAIENAMKDANEFNPFIDKMVQIFEWGFGTEMGEYRQIQKLKINAWIEPYYHQNSTELFANLATAVQNGFLSRRTASERIDEVATADEWSRIIKEKKEEDEMDLLLEIKRERQTAVISGDGNGGSVNSTRQTDENGNRPGENNWDEWDKTH